MVRAVLCVTLCAHVSSSIVAAEALPATVVDALTANATALNGVQLSGSQQRRFLMPPAEALATLKTKESADEFTQQIQFVVKLDGTRFYESTIYPPGKYHSEGDRSEVAFDGEKHYAGSFRPNAKAMPGILQIQSADTPAKFNPDVANMWFLREAGYVAPRKSVELAAGIRSLVSAAIASGTLVEWQEVADGESRLLEVVVEYPDPWASGRTNTIENDPNIASLPQETAAFQADIERQRRSLAGEMRRCRLLLDPRLNYAVLQKWESRKDTGQLLFHTVCSGFVQVGDRQLWLPMRCEVTSHAYVTRPEFVSEHPVYVTDIELTDITIAEFDSETFRIWYDAPGSLVTDYTHEDAAAAEAVGYFVPGKVRGLPRSGDESSWRAIAIAANFAALLLIVTWLVLRRRGRHSP
jgi:hypothetical protein